MREIDRRSPRAIADEYNKLLSTLNGFIRSQALDEYFETLEVCERELFDKGGIYVDPSSLMGLDIAVTEGPSGDEKVLARGVVRGIKVDTTGSLRSIVLNGEGSGVFEFERERMSIAPARRFPKEQK